MSEQQTMTLRGRVGTDLVSGRTSKEHLWVRFRLAVPQWRIDDRGRFEEKGTLWYSVKAWDRLGQNALRSLTKGQKIIVVGRPLAEAWVDKEGEVHSGLVVAASSLGHDLSSGTSHFFPSARGSAYEEKKQGGEAYAEENPAQAIVAGHEESSRVDIGSADLPYMSADVVPVSSLHEQMRKEA